MEKTFEQGLEEQVAVFNMLGLDIRDLEINTTLDIVVDGELVRFDVIATPRFAELPDNVIVGPWPGSGM